MHWAGGELVALGGPDYEMRWPADLFKAEAADLRNQET